MAQISTANLKLVLDFMAQHAAEADGIPLASAVATGAVYTVTVPNSGLSVANADVLDDLNTLVKSGGTIGDAAFSALVAGTILGLDTINPGLEVGYWQPMMDALDSYGLLNNDQITTDRGGLDTMLRVLNASTPTLRVHGLFEKYFGRVSPNNVFVPTPFTLATIAVSAADAATLSHVAALDTTLYAPGKIAIMNTKGEGTQPSTALTLNCTKNGSLTSVTFTIGAATDKYLTAGTDTSLAFTDCPAQTPGVSGGNNGDEFAVVILPDRAIV
jgi:hypothetical protein